MNRVDFAERVALRRGVPRAVAVEAVDEVIAAIQDALHGGGRVELRGFGSFSVRALGGYTGRHPRTQAPLTVAPKRLPRFRPSRLLLDRLNGAP